jgi:hypothetical protein
LQTRFYVDRLLLGKLNELQSIVKLSEIAERLQGTGIGIATIRSFLASNPEKFAYVERRWVPASRIEAQGRSLHEVIRLTVDRYGAPMPLHYVALEVASIKELEVEAAEEIVRRIAQHDDLFLLTSKDEVALSEWVFRAYDEDLERALRLNCVDPKEFEKLKTKLKDVQWRKPVAIAEALAQAAPVSAKTLGAVARAALDPDLRARVLVYDWRAFGVELLGTEGYILAPDGIIYPESYTKQWISSAIKLAETLAPAIEIEDVAPVEITSKDLDKMVAKIHQSDATVTASTLLEEFFEITPAVKTFINDRASLIEALLKDERVLWVGGDRFRKPSSYPEYILSIPEPFHSHTSNVMNEEGEYVDVELADEGLSSSLRKLLTHPLAMDVLDENPMPTPKTLVDQLRLVLRPIHRELGTFPMCQFPTGWLSPEPKIQELVFVNLEGRELQVWANAELRLLFGLIDWWYEQPIESGAVFTLTRTPKDNVFEFTWLDQPDPVVFITNQRMEQLRELHDRSEGLSTFELLREILSHWPKGADFLTILWELNVVRRTTRRMVASLLSCYPCFYQRSGSPVWHYDAKKAELGIDKTKKRFIIKR